MEELAQELIGILTKIYQRDDSRRLIHFAGGEMQMLDILNEAREGVYPKTLSETLGLSTPRVAMLCKRLEAKGLITREQDLNDYRKTIVRITDKGCKILENEKKELVQQLMNNLQQLGEQDAREYLRLYRKLLEIYNGIS